MLLYCKSTLLLGVSIPKIFKLEPLYTCGRAKTTKVKVVE